MELKEAFGLIVNTLNDKFKEGVYDLATASSVIEAVNLVGRALSAEKPVEGTATTEVEQPMDEVKSKSRSKK